MKKIIFIFLLLPALFLAHYSFAQQTEPWKTIQPGKYFSLSQIPSTIKVMDWGAEMLSKYQFPKAKDQVTLFKISVKDLGFKNGATYLEIYEAAARQGLKLCHPTDAIYLREIYLEQTENEHLYLAMEPFTYPNGEENVLSLGHNGSVFWINGAVVKDMPSKEADTYVILSSGTYFVFRM